MDDQRRQELERADREALARTRLEIAGERLAYLAAASSVLASSLDVTRTLRRLAELAVPRLADWCAVDMVADDGSIELVAVAHVDPAKVELAFDIRRRYPPDPDARIGLPAVIRSGRSELMEEIPRELIEQAAARDPELGELIDRLHLRSAMIVPITLGDRTLGAITFVRAESDTRYERDDLVLAEDLALHAAVAVENARLYEAERGARDEETQARARLEVIAEAGAAMASSLDQRTIVDALVRSMALRASDASVAYLLDRHERIAEVVAAHRDPALDPALRRAAASTPEGPTELHEVVSTILRTGDRVLEPAPPNPSAASEEAPLGRGSRIALPLTARGRTLGVLVMARAAGSEAFDEDDLQMATEVARRGGLRLDNARLYGEREEVADTLQRSLLPPDLPEVPGLDVAAASRPATQELGGDFYDVFEVDLDHWGAAIGDVVGKGAPAAAMMGLARYTLRTAGMSESRPSVLLRTLNDAILRQTRDTMFCTACFARIHRHGAAVRVTLAVGGHPLPLVLRAGGAVEPFGRPGTLLGVFEDPTLADRVTDLMPGDALVMYTDGVTDERRGQEEFGDVRLREVLSTLAGDDARSIADRVVHAVETYRTDQPQDDIAILVVRVPA